VPIMKFFEKYCIAGQATHNCNTARAHYMLDT